jgi:hypothetical protein
MKLLGAEILSTGMSIYKKDTLKIAAQQNFLFSRYWSSKNQDILSFFMENE